MLDRRGFLARAAAAVGALVMGRKAMAPAHDFNAPGPIDLADAPLGTDPVRNGRIMQAMLDRDFANGTRRSYPEFSGHTFVGPLILRARGSGWSTHGGSSAP